MVFKKYLPPRHPSTIFRHVPIFQRRPTGPRFRDLRFAPTGRRHEGCYFVDAFLRVLISGELKNIPALSFDQDFRAMGLTTIF